LSILAKKHNLKTEYSYAEQIQQLGLDLYCGENDFETTIAVIDATWLPIVCSDTLQYNVELMYSYFQTKEITNYLYLYLHQEEIKSTYISRNPFRERFDTNQDCFIHIRLGDVIHHNPGIDYYLKALSLIEFQNLFVATDSPNHPMIQQLRQVHPNMSLVCEDEVRTIQFGSTCKYLVLSHGSFSAVIGYLGLHSTVYYPKYKEGHIWYGDMFSIPGWTSVDY